MQISRGDGARPGGGQPFCAALLGAPASVPDSCYIVYNRADGTGYSACGRVALTTGCPPEPGSRDGLLLFVRDLASGCQWRLGNPAGGAAETRATAAGSVLHLEHRQDGIEALVETCVDPDRTLELRRVTLVNASGRDRRLDITSLAEVVLNEPAAHAAHPGFSKLFIQTEAVPAAGALLARRRPRSPQEAWPVLVHAVAAGDDLEWETDRLRWRGRGRHRDEPAALAPGAALSGTTGNVLDPVVSLRRGASLAPGAALTLTFLLGVGPDRDKALALAGLLRSAESVAAVFKSAAMPAGPAPTGNWPLDRDLAPAATGTAGAGIRLWDRAPAPEAADAAVPPRPWPAADLAAPAGQLRRANGLGGFTPDGREYVIELGPGPDGRLRLPPLPWTNVIANERVGCIASEAALGSAWCDNSRENRLTPWSNDPVLDPPAECFHVRDDEAGLFASCLPAPRRGEAPCVVRHGFGYTTWERRYEGLDLRTTLFVDREQPVRIVRLRLANTGARTRRLSVFGGSRLVLGGLPETTGPALEAWRDTASGALMARNPQAGLFAGHIAFAAVVTGAAEMAVHMSTDRAAYLGPDRDPTLPAALARPALDGRAGAGLDPCFALQASLELAPGGCTEVAFLLGQEREVDGARAVLAGFTDIDAVERSWQEARAFWRDGLGALEVSTPSPALDLMLGGWLGYQTLSCRMRGRSAFYQSGGAYGYRDQLQDSLSLLPYWPGLTRRQIVLHAGHQFVEGDVLHWWHPPLEAGIRTRFADDLLWLPYIACEYARQTGDWGVFDETAPYLQAPALPDGEDEVFVHAADSGERGAVFEHCCRALDRSLAVGAHGLPLFGTGDWNDGMNRVGRQGRGESTWMGFFLVAIIDAFAPLCDRRGEADRANRYRAHRDRLAAALNDGGWDGDWYRRGYYDDGAPLGSRDNRECRIDALAQAWSVLSRVAPPDRARSAMDEVERQLVSDGDRLVRLLTPPFVDTPRDPGYIRGYVAGVRENGGQYTHAATWVVRALAELGRRERAAAVLDLLNPVLHADTPAGVSRYLVEPYVVAADVYGAEPHVGRGGWTWYTGSSGWLQRVALESVLGLKAEEGRDLVVAPCVPDAWSGYTITWRLPGHGTTYRITVANPDGCAETVIAAKLDGAPLAPDAGRARIPLLRDGACHEVVVTLGPAGGRA